VAPIVESENDPLDPDWLLVSAIREAFSIARKEPITYEEAVELALRIAPEILLSNSPLVEAFESRTIRLYKERADARSRLESRQVTASELLEKDVSALSEELNSANASRQEELQVELYKLRKAAQHLAKSRWTENQAINFDGSSPVIAGSRAIWLPVSDQGQDYKEYQVAPNRKLRIRVFHPDPSEAKTGIDMIYESYWNRTESSKSPGWLVRVIALQYKMWDGKALYLSNEKNLRKQLERASAFFCGNGFCKKQNGSPISKKSYRLPNCAAFLRPTNRIQNRRGLQATRAWHVPVCKVLQALEATGDGNEILRSSRVSSTSVTHDVCHNLFNRTMLGSDWLKAKTLAALYQKIGVFADLKQPLLHCQEY
jgi:hypothetical protein